MFRNMSNKNGLIGCTSVAQNGSINANIWAKKVAPELVSPVSIVSPDTTKTGEITMTNSGDMGIYPDGGSNTVFMGLNNVSFCDLSTTPSVEVGAAGGKIYDSVYNKVATLTVLQAETSGNVTYDNTATRAAGVYQLQLSVESPVATGTSTNYLGMYVTLPPATAVVNYSGNQVTPGGVGTSLLNMNSGYFTHPGGSMRIEVNAGTPWTGTWTLQLVKVG
jgi:hypothetical protein